MPNLTEIHPHTGADAVLERIKSLLNTLHRTSTRSPQYTAVAEEIHAESVAYLALVDAERGVDRRQQGSDRRQDGADPRPRRVNRRQFGERR
jgi:hypothetical protein